MLVQLMALMLVPANTPPVIYQKPVIRSLEGPAATGIEVKPRAIAFAGDRMVVATTPDAVVHELAVRISSPAGILWQGNLRVSPNQSASYSQNLSQASPRNCPNPSPYDRSERSNINFNVYVQNSGDYGPVYRIDASWGRPTDDEGCGERGTRTVQVSKGLSLDPGESGVVEGDAGLRVDVTRRH